MLIKALRSIGLGKKEADLYLEMLTVGPQPASVLARKIGLPRSSVQFLAETLVKKGIASKHKHRNITTYQPMDPEHLMRFLEGEKWEFMKEYEKKASEIESAIPELKKLQGQVSSRPQVRFYEGKEGLKMVFEDSLSAKETIRAFVNFEERNRCLPEYFQNYYKRRVEKGIFLRAIYPNSDFGVERKKKDKESNRESLLVDKDKYKWLPEIQFYDDRVTIASGNEMVGVIIEGKEIAEAMKALYDLAWNGILLEEEMKKKEKKKGK